MAKTRTGETEPDAGALTHNPFAKLASKKVQASSGPQARDARPHPGIQSAAERAGRHSAADAGAKPALSARSRMLRVRLEARGRSGKVITRIAGLPLPNLQAIALRLHEGLGCVANVEGEDVILEGSLADRACAWLDGAGDIHAIRVEVPDRRPSTPLEPAVRPTVTSAAVASGTNRSDVRPGRRVAIVLKADQASEKLTYGVVRDILTSSSTHPRGIKVRLETGEVGRVKSVY